MGRGNRISVWLRSLVAKTERRANKKAEVSPPEDRHKTTKPTDSPKVTTADSDAGSTPSQPRSPRELKRLVARLDKPNCDYDERKTIVEALCEAPDVSYLKVLVNQPSKLYRADSNWAVELIAAKLGSQATDALIGLLTPKAVVPVHTALGILGHIGGGSVLKGLIGINPSTLPGEDERQLLRWRIRDMLKEMGANATEPLIECLSDPDPRVRFSAAMQLAAHGDERALEPLRALKYDKRHSHQFEVGDFLADLEERLAVARSEEPSAPAAPDSPPLFEVAVPDQEVFYCSDNDCPCGSPGAEIRRGEGYLYISKDVVEARKDALTLPQLEAKLQRLQQATKAAIFFDQGTIWPVLLCEQAARKRGLDLTVAAADARKLFETGRVPLRVTPKA